MENIVISVQKLTQIHSTGVENALQISFFLQNKPNSPIVQTDVTSFTTMIYMIYASLTKVKFKPNSNPIQTQTKPILANYKAWQSQNKPKFYPRFQLTLLWSLPWGVLTCFSAGGRGQTQFASTP